MFPFLRRAYLKRLVSMNALRKGLLGGSPMWRGIWVVLTLRRLWARVSKKGEAPIALSEPLGEGEAWTLVHVPEQSRRGRGEGRKYLVGPKRKPPRATALAPAALAAAGAKILEAPDAARINEILGKEVVSDPPPSRRAKRKAKRSARRADKASRQAEKRSRRTEAKDSARQAKADARSAKATAKADARSAKATAKADARSAKAASNEARREKRSAPSSGKASRSTVGGETTHVRSRSVEPAEARPHRRSTKPRRLPKRAIDDQPTDASPAG